MQKTAQEKVDNSLKPLAKRLPADTGPSER